MLILSEHLMRFKDAFFNVHLMLGLPDVCDQDVCDLDVCDPDVCAHLFVSKTFVTRTFVSILKTDVCDQELKF